MYVGAGVLQPVREVVKAVREHERQTGRQQRTLIHTDAAQVSYVLHHFSLGL